MKSKKNIRDYEKDFDRIARFYHRDVKYKKPANRLMSKYCKDCSNVILLIDSINNYKVCNKCGRCYPLNNKVEQFTAKGSYIYTYNSANYFAMRIEDKKYEFSKNMKISLQALFCRNFILIMMIFNSNDVYRCNYEYLIYNLLLDFDKQAANTMRYYVPDRVYYKYREIWNNIKKHPSYFKP